MDSKFAVDTLKISAYTSFSGAVIMVIGAILWGTSGTDLWVTLDTGDMAGYLVAAGAVKGQLVANLTFWIAGVLVLGVAGAAMSHLCVQRRALGQIALMCIRTGVPLVIVSYIAMLSLVVQIAPDTSATSVAIANVVGWIGARADDLATALILGAMPFFLALAGRDEWMPTWLVWWGYLKWDSWVVFNRCFVYSAT